MVLSEKSKANSYDFERTRPSYERGIRRRSERPIEKEQFSLVSHSPIISERGRNEDDQYPHGRTDPLDGRNALNEAMGRR